MKATILLSLLVSMIVLEVTDAGRNFTAIPAWVRRQMRRGRRRNGGSVFCNDYENSRCAFGTCYLAAANYPDIPENFENDKNPASFFCMCTAGYETYYESNQQKDVPTGVDSWCNAEENPCRTGVNPNPCQTQSPDNMCRHTGANDYVCECTMFWEGRNCEKDVDECKPCNIGDGTGCPCKNGATCRNTKQSDDNPLGFTCYCELGTDGPYCEKITDACLRKPCLTKAEFGGAAEPEENACSPVEIDLARPQTLNGYECKCKDGWGGLNCELRQGACTTNPCEEGGRCAEDPNFPSFYQCFCNPGYKNNEEALNTGSGVFCSEIIDLCASQPCRNGGTCLLIGANNFICVCTPDWNGPNCESHPNPCYSTIPGKEKCLNNGICSKASDDSGTAYTCDCSGTGYTGDYCETDDDECSPSQCDPRGTRQCVNNVGGFECQCNDGYLNIAEDKTCARVESLCTSMPDICLYGGLCTPGAKVVTNFLCDCSTANPGSTLAKDDGNQAFKSGNDDGRCVKPIRFDKLEFNKVPLTSQSAPVSGAVYFTRKGGIMDNPFMKLNYGAFATVSQKDILKKKGWMILYFNTPAQTAANLMTVTEMETKFEIVASSDRLSFDLKFPLSDPPITISLPRHSLKSWNSIWVLVTENDVTAYLNSAFIKKERFTDFTGFGKDQTTVFGSSVDENGNMAEPFFNGGIADLFFGEIASTTDSVLESFKQNFGMLHAPECQRLLDLTMDTRDPYRDAGCMRFDPIAVVEELFSEGVTVNDQYFPLVKFGPLKYPADNMKPYVTVKSDAEMVVPNFPYLFQDPGASAQQYSMMFRFRRTYLATPGEKTTFLFSRVLGTTNNDNVIEAGTQSDAGFWWFVLKLKTTAEEKEIESPKYSLTDCSECVYSFVINWDARDPNGEGADNIVIHYLSQGKQGKTTYTIQGKIDPAKVSSLVFGKDGKHQIGRTRFWVGGQFSDTDITNFLTKGEEPPNAMMPNNNDNDIIV